MSTPFRERNPVIIGAISLAVLAAFVLAAFKAEDLPLIGGGDTYYAAFSEAGGLKANDEVRVAGVRVGKVRTVDLQGDHVRVEFKVDKGVDFGRTTGAAIKVKTLLGAMYQSLNTLGALTQNTPAEFKAALNGLSDLSSTIASKDAQLGSLLTHMRKVSGVLGDRRTDVVTLMRDGDVLFRALAARRQSVHNLLVATSQLSVQLTGLVRDTRADLKPALDHLGNVVDVLRKNQQNLDSSLRLMAPFYRVFANTLGNGPWFDTYIQNLPPVPQVGG
jgi:phospholipid/cholesterol/gamma-HCH transport system substrate-binding protein